MNLVEKYAKLKKVYQYVAPSMGWEADEEKLVANRYDFHKIDSLLNIPQGRQAKAFEQMTEQLAAGGQDNQFAAVGLDVQNDAYAPKLMRRMDAFIQRASVPFNFKQQAALEKYGKKLFEITQEAILKDVPAQQIVKMRSKGLI